MAPVISKRIGLMRYGVMLFSLAYLCLSIATAIYILTLKRSIVVTIIAIYCYVQVCANWRAMFANSNKDYGIQVEEGLEQNIHNFCSECNIYKNKKSHHCPLCECCVLRHDHHCFFLGTCIGLNNQRYFVILCLYTGVGSLYLSLQIFLASDWVFNRWFNYLELFMPFGYAFSLARTTTLSGAYLVIVYNLSATIGMFCMYMFGLQVHLLSQSVTWHEFNSKTHVSKNQQILTTWSNFTTNFGHGLLHFIVPVMSGFLPSSKGKFPRTKSDERVY
ncbi:uncharacterized protein LOC132087806 [Daphnia carinata]|uniref:uncharacterized protein LOC132087806 n=1 Tax=Daphnia carinata TaxID=120202 RepID=UPI0028693353|nr:uncharacterized protein LOC132087806 [Daphnia carinata]